jgi:hypothetical protein
MLPDRHALLQLVDQLPSGGERVAAMTACHGDDHRQITDSQLPDPVNRGERDHVVRLDHLLGDLAQGGVDARVRRVVESRHVSAVIVVADRADEQGDATGMRIAHDPEHLVDRELRITHLEQPDGVGHAPDSSVSATWKPAPLRPNSWAKYV